MCGFQVGINAMTPSEPHWGLEMLGTRVLIIGLHIENRHVDWVS